VTPTDIAVLTKVMGPVMREFTAKAVAEAVAPLVARNAALEQRILELETRPEPQAGPVGPIGQKGADGAGIASLVISADNRLLAHLTDGKSIDAGPVPVQRGEPGERGERGEMGPEGRAGAVGAPGENGTNGKDAPPLDMDAVVTRVLALVPPPAKGEKGDPGERGPQGEGLMGPAGPQGERGIDGKNVDMDAVTAHIDARLSKAIDAIPTPKDGKDGQPGADGRWVTLEDVAPFIAKEIEQRIAALPVAKDGLGFTAAVINREGHLVLTRSDGATQDVGPVIGKDGAPGLDGKDAIGTPGRDGKDGADGLGFDDYDLYLDETRGWILRLEQGERFKEFVLGMPFDAKVWSAGTVYPKGAGVTSDGHYWIAQAQTSEPPGEGNPAWRIAVRRGKQGREGQKGKDGAPGRDLTQMDERGRKW
jgi:hypothetical protein